MRQLFYVIGPSGSGKDSLMSAARAALVGQGLLFAHRYITRDTLDEAENFIRLDPAEFAIRQQFGLFWLSWQSHQLSYAVGKEVLAWLCADIPVVVNGSREALPKVKQLCAQDNVIFTPVWIHCDAEILAQRLALRGRENAQQIQERLQRAAQFSPPEAALVIDNSDKLSDALAQWMPYLQSAIRHVD